MDTEITMGLPSGASCSSIPKAAERLCRSKSWVWAQIQKNPEFPKPVKIGADSLLLNHELDAWLAAQVAKSRTA
jgi:predicted DNA-binding transcriptional regulator AlpA